MPATRLAQSIALAALAVSAAAQSSVLEDGLREFRGGNLAGAEARFRKLLEGGDNPTARVFLALAEAGTGRCEQAVPELKRDLAATDAGRLAGLALVQCETRAGHFDDAFAAVARLKALYPEDADVLFQAARLYSTAWNETVKEMFEKTPASFRVNQLSAEVFETQEKYDAAVAEYRKAAAKSPKTAGLHFRLGRALLMQSHEPGNLIEARKEFEAELALNPFDAAAEYEVAQILLAQQKQDEAAVHFQRAVDLSPEFTEGLIALAKLKTSDAIPLLEKAVKLAPRSEAAHMGLMMAYRNAGRANDAQAQKDELDKLMKPPEGEFSNFLKKLGEQKP